jgi:hypothetical protein
LESRVEKYKKKRKTKKAIILISAVILTIGIGSGMKTTFADADVSTMLINWFNNKQSDSIREIDTAITAEKDILLADLRAQLKIEMEAAESDLDQFTEQVKSERIASLREHASTLIANINIDNSEEQAAITSNINSIVENAIAQMNGAATAIPKTDEVTIPVPPVKTEPVEVPIIQPEPIKEPVSAPVTPTPVPSPVTDPIIAPVPESNVETEAEIKTTANPTIPEPISTPDLSTEKVQANRDSSLEDELTE